MADRVYPRNYSPDQTTTKLTSENNNNMVQSQGKPLPPPTGTYVIQIPKDQIYRIPLPENARRYEKLSRKNTRRNPCCCCFCWILSIILLLILLTVSAAVAFYFIYKPKQPNYSVENMSIKGFDFTRVSSSQSDLTVSPVFDVTVRAENPNSRIGIYYEKGSNVSVSHTGTDLCSGVLPNFYQPRNNVTVFETVLKTPSLKLSKVLLDELYDQQKKGQVPLGVDIKVPARVKVGSIRTWLFTVRVHCDVIVDKLAADSKIVSNKCSVDPKFWKN
ncbi:hypothetical protein MKX01_011190 [Papaver californicum]|nr:hypothetical protein MKX01_011190 [Papaver californicum]